MASRHCVAIVRTADGGHDGGQESTIIISKNADGLRCLWLLIINQTKKPQRALIIVTWLSYFELKK